MLLSRPTYPQRTIFILAALLCVLIGLNTRPPANLVLPAALTADFLSLPLAFVPDGGADDTAVSVHAHLPGGALRFTPTAVSLTLPPANQVSDAVGQEVRLHFAGANPQPELSLTQRLPGVVNYIIGDDPAQWKTQLPTYAGLVYRQLYDGIDLHYEGNMRALKGTYYLAPGASPDVIRWSFAGVTGARLHPENGDLILTLPGSEPAFLVEEAPIAWQTINGQRLPVDIRYILHPAGEGQTAVPSLGFAVGAYDPTYPLIIDPALVYSALIGGGAFDEGRAIAVDGAGNVYLTGNTLSTNFPNAGPPQNSYGGSNNNNFGDAFIAKLNPAGNALLYMTYLGGSGVDIGEAITVDSQGNAYVTGLTESDNFPTTANAYQQTRLPQTCSTPPCADAFVTKLNAAGNALIFSTYLGGSGEENVSLLDTGTRNNSAGIAVDSSLNVYVTGVTFSTNFPIQSNAFSSSNSGLSDIFLAKLSANGQNLLYGTYLGGTGAEHGGDLVVDNAGVVTLTGATLSGNFPLKNALQNSLGGGADAVVAQIDTSQSGSASLIFSTYLGGSGSDYGFGIGRDGSGIYVAGHTTSLDLPSPNGFQTSNGSAGSANPLDVFLVKLNPAGSARLYGTYLGGSSADVAYDLALDAQGHVYLTGTTNSNNFPLRDSFEPRSDFRDIFVAKFDPAQSGDASLLYSSLFGTSLNEYSYGIAVDAQGNAYVTGYGSGVVSADFPIHTTIGANGIGNGVLVAKFGPQTPPYSLYLPVVIGVEIDVPR